MKRFLGMFLPILMSVIIFGCAGMTPVPEGAAFKPVAYTCASAAFALETATTLRAKMSAETQAAITRAAGILNPVCSQENPPTVSSVTAAAMATALKEITTANSGVTK